MSSKIEYEVGSAGDYFSENYFFALSPDRKNVMISCVDGQCSVSSDHGKSFTELNMPFKDAGQMLHKSSLSDVDSFVVSFNDGVVNHYVYDRNTMIEVGLKVEKQQVTKCPGPVTALAISPNGKIIICCGQDNETRIFEVKKLGEYPVIAKLPVSHFIEAVKFSPDGNQFATIDCNGHASVYTIASDSFRPSDPILLQSEPCTRRQGCFEISWSPSFLSFLAASERVMTYNRSNWESVYMNCFNEDVYSFSMVSDKLAFLLSPSGISAIATQTEKPFCKLLASEAYLQIDKQSTQNSFEVNQSELCALSDSKLLLILHKGKVPFVHTFKATISAEDLNAGKTKTPVAGVNNSKSGALEKLAQKKKRKQIVDFDSEEEAESMLDNEANLGSEDAETDSEDSMSVTSEHLSAGSDVSQDDDLDLSPRSDYHSRVAHPLVQPGSTPWRNLQRFMAYNGVGFVTARRDSENLEIFNYDIELMDRGTHKPIRFSEAIEYELAALSEAGVLFANQSSIHFIPLADRKQSWTVEMKPNSKPVLVAVSSEHCYVALKRGVINVYTVGGIFLRTFVCPAEPVSMVASSTELAFFGQDSQGITCHILTPQTGVQMSSSRVLLFTTSHDEISWCGFNSAGVLAAFTTSARMLLRLTRSGEQWTEVLDLAGHSDIQIAWPCYFDVMSMSVIKCSFEERIPDPYPPKPMTEISFSIPEAPDTVIEEVIRTRLIVHETNVKSSDALTEKERKKLDTAADRHLLEMAQLAIRAGRFGRVVELAKMASNEKTVDLMIQLAKHHKLIAVVDDLERIRFPTVSAPVAAAVVNKPVEPISADPTPIAQVAEAPLPQVETPLTPIKCAPSVESVLASSVDPSPAPVNPFLKSLQAPKPVEEPKSSVMLDYISNIMKMTVKRKADPNENDQSQNKRSA